MSIEEAIQGGIVFKGKKDKPKEEEKVKTKAKKATYIRGQHGSGAAKMKADIRRKRANVFLYRLFVTKGDNAFILENKSLTEESVVI